MKLSDDLKPDELVTSTAVGIGTLANRIEEPEKMSPARRAMIEATNGGAAMAMEDLRDKHENWCDQ